VNDEDTFPIDLQKLSLYFEFQLNMRRRTKGKSSYKISNFRKCKIEDFTRHGFEIGEFERSIYLNRFCPEIDDKVLDDYRVMNGYTNYTDRNSFAVEIIKCNINKNKNCKSENDIAKVLDLIYFTFYYLEESIQFANNKLGNRPIETRDVYHSQFKLDLNSYIDNNNYLRLN